MSVQKHRLTKNSLAMILSRILAQGLAVIFTILLARRLGSAEFGEYAFIAAVIFVANALTTFGTDMLLIREIAAKDDLSGLPAALMLQLSLSVFFIAALWIFGAQIPNQSLEVVTALKVYSLALIPLAFFSVFTIALRGKQLMEPYAVLNIILSLLQLGAVLILHNGNLVLLSVFLLSAQFLAALIAGLLCTFFISNFWQSWHLSSLREHQGGAFLLSSSFFKACLPIAVLALLTMLYQRLGVTMLSLMTSPGDTGIFSAAARIVEASKTAHIAVFAALYPALAQGINRWSSNGVGSYRYRDQRFTMVLLFAGAACIALILFVIATPLINFLYGVEFTVSTNVLKILVWTMVPFTINTYFTLSFLASRREALVGRGLTVSLLGLLILNLWWIPSRGPEGCAWASLVAECLQSLLLLASTRSSILTQGEAHEFPQLS